MSVVVWIADLDAAAPNADLLTREEQDRAARFLEPLQRRRWIAARGWLRVVLSRHTGIAPEHVPVQPGPLGKPALAGSDLRFSVSHSGGIALFGLSESHDIGVDIEQAAGDPESFLLDWTSREAYLKAIGFGLAAGLDGALPHSGWTIEHLRPAPGFVAAIAVANQNAEIELRWLNPAPDFVCHRQAG